ncbi:MAG: sialidase family protein [Candidatus Omnitrophota bacterium]|nr:sialidase family protein [Candidatus Omnitrophota bacterium]
MKRNIFLIIMGLFLTAALFTPLKETLSSILEPGAPVISLPAQTMLPESLSPYTELPYKELIVPPEPSVSLHTPCVVELPDGELFAVYSHTMDWRSRRSLWSSRLPPGAREWTKPSVIKNNHTMDEKNPVLFLDKDNKLRMLWALQQNPSKWNHRDIIQVRVSNDLGNTWEEAHNLGTPVGYLTRTHPVRLHNGWFVLPIYMDWSASSAVVISKDGGLTWGKPKWILPFLGIEPAMIQRSDQSLFALMRSGMWPRRCWQAVSKDLGRNWKERSVSDINNPGSALDMVKLRNGHVVLVFNNSKKNRYNLSLALSYDDGKTWPHIKSIEDQDGHVYAYPSIIQDRYGLIHVVYAYDNHRNIAHFVTNEKWIED